MTDALDRALTLLQASFAASTEDGLSLLIGGPCTAGELVAALHDAIRPGAANRHDLEAVFFDAKQETSDPDVLADISRIWDRVVPAFPEPHPDQYVGSSAEVTGDYGRLYFARLSRTEPNENAASGRKTP